MKLLGSLAPSPTFPYGPANVSEKESCELLLRSQLVRLASDPDSIDPMELESAALLLQSWLPSLHLDDETRALIHVVIRNVLACFSHFVRKAGIIALRTLIRSTGQKSKEFVVGLLTNLSRSPSHTTFDTITCISETDLAHVLSGHEVMSILWSALESSDAVLSESARCCFRSLIFSGNGSLLGPDINPSALTAHLDAVIERCLQTLDRLAIVNSVFLLDFRSSSASEAIEYQNSFHIWSISAALALLGLYDREMDSVNSLMPELWSIPKERDPNSNEIHMFPSHLRWRALVAKLPDFRSDLLLDLIISVFLRNTHSHSKYLLKLIPLVLDDIASRLASDMGASKSLSFWQTVTKFCKLLGSNIDLWTESSRFVVPLFNEALRSVSTPTSTKVAVLSVIASSCQKLLHADPVNWKLFDAVATEVQASRYSISWEIRDSVVELFGSLSAACPDLNGCVARNFHAAILAALRESSEHVRSSAYTALEAMISRPAWWKILLDSEPNLPAFIFGTVDSQTSSRISQALSIRALIKLDHVLEYLNQKGGFPTLLHRTMEVLFADDDWDVRIEVVHILETLWNLNGSMYWWNEAKAHSILESTLLDESRMVQKASWSLVAKIRGSADSGAQIFEPTLSAGVSLNEIEQLLMDLEVDVHYNPDDEVYPLAPGVADNDLDCPF